MSKRSAAVQLTSDNVDQQEEIKEDAGKFLHATSDELQRRVIKKARRNLTNEGGSSIFAGLRSVNSGGGGLFVPQKPPTTNEKMFQRPQEGVAKPQGGVSTGYMQQLKGLNESVSAWIAQHVKTNPHVDLTPIFKDYDKHLKDIDAKHKLSNGVVSMESSSQESAGTSESEVTDDNASQSTDDTAESPQMDSESQSSTDNTPATNGGDEHTQETTTEQYDTDQATVDYNDQATVDYNDQATAEDTEQATAEDTTAEDTKPATSEVSIKPAENGASNEDDSLFTVRSKLFYKKGSEYTELGIGTLKVQSSSGKSVRLLLRNDTTLSKVVLNVNINATIPLSSKGNNVLVVCPANPPLGVTGPVTYLMRVKTAQLASQLLAAIKDNTE